MPFLKIVTYGRGIPEARLKNVAHHYEDLGGFSPINALTAQQAASLEKRLAETGDPLPVYVGNKNWRPFLIHTLKKMTEDGVQEAVGFITAAHRTESSHQSYIQAVQKAKKLLGNRMPHITYPDPWHTHPLFIEAICERIKETAERIREKGKRITPEKQGATTGKDVRENCGISFQPSPLSLLLSPSFSWIFVAHSIPTPMARASRYAEELAETAEHVSQKFGKKEWILAYCSRSGRPTDPWLEPDVSDEIKRQAAMGTKRFLIIPIGFLVDHVEVLFDLDREAKETADKLGAEFIRVGTVGSHPLFVDMMADVVHRTLHRSSFRIVPAPSESVLA